MQSKEEVNAKKQTLTEPDALELAKGVNHIYVAKGKKVVHLNMKKDQPDAQEIDVEAYLKEFALD